MRNIVVKSSIALTASQKKKLEKGLEKKYGAEVVYTYLQDEILGGIVVDDGEHVIDYSFSSLLKDFRAQSDVYFDEVVKNKGELPAYWGKELVDKANLDPTVTPCGRVVASADGIITIEGLPDCKYYELLEIGDGNYAIAMNLLSDCVKAMLITGSTGIEYGVTAIGTGKIVEVPVGDGLLGRVVNPLGKPIDGDDTLRFDKVRPIERGAPKIIDRDKVTRPLLTGILAIDSMIPIGKGQRELIIGDRQTGKSSIAIDAIINQKDKDVICIYVAIGQRAGTIGKLIAKLKNAGAMKNTVLVVSTASDNAALQYIAPYTGCAIGEEFMAQGKDVLIVYDDLSKHANAYRTISLLLKRPSGREAYPGDVFYIHSRLLERSAQLSSKKGGGSMTAIPIIETQAGDISQYIPTNVISITDGQIYLESELFNSGVRPAVNVGLSVSRVGGSAQFKAVRKLSSQLRLDLAHYRELALFAQFGAEVDDNTRAILAKGEKVTEILKQKEGDPMSVDREIIYLYMIGKHIDDVPANKVNEYIEGFYRYFAKSDHLTAKEIRESGAISGKAEKAINKALNDYNVYYTHG